MTITAQYGTAVYGDSQYGVLLLNASSGAYSITGGSATFLYNQRVDGNAGSYTIAGQSASLVTNKRITGNAGSYTLTGQEASLITARAIISDNGNYAITGVSAGGIYNQTIFAGNGSYTITGQDATFDYDRRFICNTGSYIFTGSDATLSYNHGPAVVIETKGGIDKKRAKKLADEKKQREDLEALVKREFDKLDGTYQPEVVEKVKTVFIPEIKQIDLNEYAIAIAQVNALLLQAKIQAAEYESELDDEEALLMLL